VYIDHLYKHQVRPVTSDGESVKAFSSVLTQVTAAAAAAAAPYINIKSNFTATS
jgi:hypothetical protein